MYKYQMNEKSKKRWPFLLFTFVISMVGSYFVQSYLTMRIGSQYNIQRLTTENMEMNNLVDAVSRADVISEAMKSVVGISMLRANEESLFDIALAEKWGLGTGIIISEEGYILTNQHLARNKGTRLIVNFENGENEQGRVVWCNENIDLAIVKVDRKNLYSAKIGDSDELRIGDEVMAIGNPLGVEFQRTTTCGIISGLNRTLTFEENDETVFMEDLIQTDASINSGNSGGPLINEKGEVVGVNTIKITDAEGLGFAVPINIVVPIIDKLINTGDFKEAKIGAFVYDKEIIKYVKSNVLIERGLYITNIAKDSAADIHGLKEGDIIISVDGVELTKVTDLRRYIYTKEPGEEVSLIINRNNRIENIKVRLE